MLHIFSIDGSYYDNSEACQLCACTTPARRASTEGASSRDRCAALELVHIHAYTMMSFVPLHLPSSSFPETCQRGVCRSILFAKRNSQERASPSVVQVQARPSWNQPPDTAGERRLRGGAEPEFFNPVAGFTLSLNPWVAAAGDKFN